MRVELDRHRTHVPTRRKPLPPVASDPLLLGAIVLALATRIAFWAYTDRVWEDALITITHARNAVDGIGLIHHVGEGRVQGFTSPISVLVPLLGELVHAGAGITALRLASLAATVPTLVYAYLICTRLELARVATAFVLVFLAIDEHQILFGMAGMETQIAVAVLLGGFWYVLDSRPRAAGIALGAALLTRPDFLIWVVAALVWFAVRRRADLKQAAAWAAVVGLPWYVFATAYYGTPIPETVKAKAAGFAAVPSFGAGPSAWLHYLWHQPGHQPHVWKNFGPFIEDWPARTVPLHPLMSGIAIAIIALALVGIWSTWRAAAWRPAIAFLVVFSFYLVFGGRVDWFSWYLPPYVAGVVILAAGGLTRIGRRAPRPVAAAAAVMALAFAAALPFDWKLEWTIQHKIENQVRRPLAQYIARGVAPGQTLGSESSGYIGYYGKAKLLDFPGLTSPKALAVVKTIPPSKRSFAQMAARLKPDWLVVRPFEAADLKLADPRMAKLYVLDAVFQVTEQSVPLKAGPLKWWNVDRSFALLRRNDVSPRKPPE